MEAVSSIDSGAPSQGRGLLAGRRKWLIGAAGLAIASPALWFVGTRPLVSALPAPGARGGPAKGVGPLIDFEAPGFTLKDPTGKSLQLKQYRGKAVLLNFWATWCVPCRDEMPEMEKVYRRHPNELVVLAVTINDENSARDVPEYLREGAPSVGAYTFPVGVDSKLEVAKAYKIGGVPTSYFIDPAGIIRAVQPGAMSEQVLLEKLRTVMDL